MIFLLGNYTPCKTGETSLLGSKKAYQLTNIENIYGDIADSVLENDDLFFTEFGFEMEHIGYLNPSLSRYLVSLNYDFRELRLHIWLPVHSSPSRRRNIPCIMNTDSHTQIDLQNMLQAALWVIRKNATGDNELAKKWAKNFITPLAACRFINKMCYNKQLNMSFCLDT